MIPALKWQNNRTNGQQNQQNHDLKTSGIGLTYLKRNWNSTAAYLHFGLPSSITQVPPLRHFRKHSGFFEGTKAVGKVVSQRFPLKPLGHLEIHVIKYSQSGHLKNSLLLTSKRDRPIVYLSQGAACTRNFFRLALGFYWFEIILSLQARLPCLCKAPVLITFVCSSAVSGTTEKYSSSPTISWKLHRAFKTNSDAIISGFSYSQPHFVHSMDKMSTAEYECLWSSRSWVKAGSFSWPMFIVLAQSMEWCASFQCLLFGWPHVDHVGL